MGRKPTAMGAGTTEAEILKFLDQQGSATVGEVAEHIASIGGQARTTVLTTMERLRTKGALTRRKVGGVFRYSPKLERRTRLKGLVDQFVRRSLAGSIAPFVAYLEGAPEISADELAELREVVERIESRRRGDER